MSRLRFMSDGTYYCLGRSDGTDRTYTDLGDFLLDFFLGVLGTLGELVLDCSGNWSVVD